MNSYFSHWLNYGNVVQTISVDLFFLFHMGFFIPVTRSFKNKKSTKFCSWTCPVTSLRKKLSNNVSFPTHRPHPNTMHRLKFYWTHPMYLKEYHTLSLKLTGGGGQTVRRIFQARWNLFISNTFKGSAFPRMINFFWDDPSGRGKIISKLNSSS